MLFRDDDIYMTESPTRGSHLYNFEKFKECHELIASHGDIHILGIVAGEIENYPELTKYIKEHQKEMMFAVHGWMHYDYSLWKADKIYKSMMRAKNKITEVFGEVPQWYFPPWNRRNDEVMKAALEAKLRVSDNYVTPDQYLMGQRGELMLFHYWSENIIPEIKKYYELSNLHSNE